MKQVFKLSACLLAAGALILSSCKKDDEEPEPVVPVTPAATIPQESAQKMFLPLNGSANPSVGTASVLTNTVTWTSDRHGNANSAAYFAGATAPGNGQVIEYSGNFIYPSTTISFWYKLNPATFGPGSRQVFGAAAWRGIFMEIAGDQAWMKMPTAHAVDPSGTPDHLFGTAWNDVMNGGSPVGGQLLFNYNNPGGTGLKPLINNENWHHVVMTYDQLSSLKTVFIDGMKIMQSDLDLDAAEWPLKGLAIASQNDDGTAATGYDSDFTLGYSAGTSNALDGWNTYATEMNSFQGAMDDFRIWNVALSETEVAALYDLEN